MIITVSNKKGGCGKTVTALALAGYFGMAKKNKVLLIDLDNQHNSSRSSGADKTLMGIYDFLKGEKLDDCVQESSGYDLLAADSRLAEDNEFKNEKLLAKLLKGLDYTHIVIDTPPAMNNLVKMALTASDYVLIPVKATDAFAIDAVSEVLNNIKGIMTTNKNLKILGLLPTMYDARTALANQLCDNFKQIAENNNFIAFEPIRNTIAISEAALKNENLFMYAPKTTNAVIDYEKLCKAIAELTNSDTPKTVKQAKPRAKAKPKAKTPAKTTTKKTGWKYGKKEKK